MTDNEIKKLETFANAHCSQFECDGTSRVLSKYLDLEKIPYNVVVGEFGNKNLDKKFSPHFWIETWSDSGYPLIIDFKGNMWLEDAPNGVFYQGEVEEDGWYYEGEVTEFQEFHKDLMYNMALHNESDSYKKGGELKPQRLYSIDEVYRIANENHSKGREKDRKIKLKRTDFDKVPSYQLVKANARELVKNADFQWNEFLLDYGEDYLGWLDETPIVIGNLQNISTNAYMSYVIDGNHRLARAVKNNYDIQAFVPSEKFKIDGGGGTFDKPISIKGKGKIFDEGGVTDKDLCTYNFVGYEMYEKKCKNESIIYLLAGEYNRVARWLYKNHYGLWLYYNYLNRITASTDDTIRFADQWANVFKPPIPVQLGFKTYKQGTSWFFWWSNIYSTNRDLFITPPSSFKMTTATKYRGVTFACRVALKKGTDVGWTQYFKVKGTPFTIPALKDGVHLLTTIHEYAHALDFERQVRSKMKRKFLPNETIARGFNPVTTHKKGFLIALKDILLACKDGRIPIVKQLDQRAILMQEALLTTDMGEKIKAEWELEKISKPLPKKRPRNENFISRGWFKEIKSWLGNEEFMEINWELPDLDFSKNKEKWDILIKKLKKPSSNEYNEWELKALDGLLTEWKWLELDYVTGNNPSKANSIYNQFKILKNEVHKKRKAVAS